MKKKIPRVLIISEFYFNENSGGGVLLKNLFEKYPKDKLFILHEDVNANTNANLNSYLLKKPSKIGGFLKKFLHPLFIMLLIELKNFYKIKKKKKLILIFSPSLINLDQRLFILFLVIII